MVEIRKREQEEKISASGLNPFRYSLYRALWTAALFSYIGAAMYDVGASWLMTSLAPNPLFVFPDGKAKIKIVRVLAVVIRETNSGLGASEVINHDAPVSYIAAPTYEKRAVIHNVLYIVDLKGLNPDAEISSCLSSCLSLSTIENK